MTDDEDDRVPARRARKRRPKSAGPRFRPGARIRVTVTEEGGPIGLGSYAGSITGPTASGAAWRVELELPGREVRELVLTESEMELL